MAAGMQSTDKGDKNLFESVLVARQPIFDCVGEIWGYELFCRQSEGDEYARVVDPDEATAKIIADGVSIVSDTMSKDTRLIVNFSRNLLLLKAPMAFAPETFIPDLEIRKPDKEVLAACHELLDAGYQLSIDLPAPKSLVQLASIIRIDVSRFPYEEVRAVIPQLKALGVKVLATKVENEEMYRTLLGEKVDYFQGFFFSKPVTVKGRKLGSSEIAKLNSVAELSKPDYDVDKLTRTISTDPGLSYRLLKFVNSAYFGIPREIQSVQQAIALLGQQPLKYWLMAVGLSSHVVDARLGELYFSSIQRGRFLELLAEKSNKLAKHKETFLLLGIFSKLDALLGKSMEEITEKLPLHDELKAALCGKQNVYHTWLELLNSVEKGAWADVDHVLKDYGLTVKMAAVSYNSATMWAAELVKATQNGDGGS